MARSFFSELIAEQVNFEGGQKVERMWRSAPQYRDFKLLRGIMSRLIRPVRSALKKYWRFCAMFGMALFAMVSLSAVAKEPVYVAVAANFAETARTLGERFSALSNIKVVVSSASSGQHYAQISNGAPFDIFLSADQVYAEKLEANGLVVPLSRFTYATGRLVLVSYMELSEPLSEGYLRSKSFRRIAIANPRLAPYGAAAQTVLEKLNVWNDVQERVVRAENVQQALQFLVTGNVDVAFVALSQAISGAISPRRMWRIPTQWYPTLNQDAVLLMRAKNNSDARAFYQFLSTPLARATIDAAGYGLVAESVR